MYKDRQTVKTTILGIRGSLVITAVPLIFLWLTHSSIAQIQVSQIDEQKKTANVQPVSVTVNPRSVISWLDLVNAEQVMRGTGVGRQQKAVPFMPLPVPGDVGLALNSGVPIEILRGRLEPNEILRRRGELGSRLDSNDVTQSLAPMIGTSFLALPDNNMTIPPDTMGAVGPSHVMTMLNSEVRIQTKAGGIISTVSLGTFWAPAGTESPFDPHLLYDSLSGRWIATCDADARLATAKVFFAISATSDPTGSWSFFSFVADSTGVDWADFPGFGVNSTWIAITNNMFTVTKHCDDPIDAIACVAGTACTTSATCGAGATCIACLTGVKMWVIDKSTALAGGPLTVTIFPTGFTLTGGVFSTTLKPCLTFDAVEPKLYLMDNTGFTTGGVHMLRMSEVTGAGASPSWSPTAGSIFAGTGLFTVANNYDPFQVDSPQSGTAMLVNTNDKRMLNTVFRNGKIWCTHSAGLPIGPINRTAVFWYQLDPALLVSSGAPIVQSGVLDGGSGVHHFFPSITSNAVDDVCIGFSRSDSTRFIEAVFSGRLGTDTLGVMDPITVLKAGEDSYVKDFGTGRIRWGDYSATVVDPSDDMSFWTIQEYAALDVGPAPSDDRWGTWWGSKSDPCGDGVCDPPETKCSCPADCPPPGPIPPNEIAACADGIDNDCDGPIDCVDSDCWTDPVCIGFGFCGDGLCISPDTQCNCAADCGAPPATESSCVDGIDNDCDGCVDVNDIDCGGIENCTDGIDNNCNGLTDCNDPGCVAAPACTGCPDGVCMPSEICTCSLDCGPPAAGESPGFGTCADGLDNDCDGCVDGADSGCGGTETSCTDGIDNDCDNATDCSDADCAADPGCAPVCPDGACHPSEDQCTCPLDCGSPPASESGACADVFDNDCDGCLDNIDSDCGGTETNCTDGLDDDCDGAVDCADSDCGVGSEAPCCSDGADNDADGCTDGADSDCGGTETNCTDGVDNDCDGVADCNDVDCSAAPVCAAPSPPVVAAGPNGLPKVKYLSIDASVNGVTPLEIRVRETGSGIVKWVANPTIPSEVFPHSVLVTVPPGPRDWSAETVLHITGCLIQPGGNYDVVFVNAAIPVSSPPLNMSTTPLWGMVNADAAVNVLDILETIVNVSTFGVGGSVPGSHADVAGDAVSGTLNVLDILSSIAQVGSFGVTPAGGIIFPAGACP